MNTVEGARIADPGDHVDGHMDARVTIGVELFELADGSLMANEFAPRVHNSGHWTLDGCEVDQFEQS